MSRFTTDELVAASALLISGIVSLAPDESLATSHRESCASSSGDFMKKEQDPSLISRLGLSHEQQRLIRTAFEKKRAELKALSELLDQQREELYNLRFQVTEHAERRLDTLAAQHVETRLALHTLHAEMQQEIEAILTPAQRNMAAHLRYERTLPQPGKIRTSSPRANGATHH